MFRSVALAALLPFCLPLAAAQQPPAPPPAKPPEPAPAPAENKVEPAAPEAIVDTAVEASKLLADSAKAFADKEPRVRAEAISRFVSHRNEAYVKPLAAFLKDPNADVVKMACKALGNQPFPKSIDVLLDYATHPKLDVNDETATSNASEAIRALASTGLGKKGFERLRDVFDAGTKEMKVAIFEALASKPDKRSFTFFVDHNDAPEGNASDPNNAHPASYWKARFEEWNEYKQYVRRGLKEMTGRSFATTKQWIEWGRSTEAKKAGFEYGKDR